MGLKSSAMPAAPWTPTYGPSTPLYPRTGPTSGTRPAASWPRWSASNQQAEELLAQSRARLQDAGGCRWARTDHQAVVDAQAQLAAAEDQAQQATSAERDLRERLAALAEHQQQRQDHIAAVAAERQRARHYPRPGRRRPGPHPPRPGRRPRRRLRPITCSAGSDRRRVHLQAGPCGATTPSTSRPNSTTTTALIPPWTGWSPQTDLARRQIAIADRVLQASSDRPGPTEWAELAQQAGTVFDQVLRAERDRAASQRTPGQWQQPQPWADLAAGRPRPGVSL